MSRHPAVSEDHEGQPWFEWIVAILVVICAVLAFFGYTTAATVIIAVTAIATGVIRLVMRERSPWKVRSIAFDATAGIGFGIAALLLFFSIQLLRF